MKGSLAIKPFHRVDFKLKRLPERKPVSMTIAMGAYCAGGIILCADTNIVAGDQKWQGLKMSHVMGKVGSFAIANSSEDVNAANTIIRNLMDALRDTEIKNRQQLESLVTSKMTKWARAYQVAPPRTQFILAAYLHGSLIPEDGLLLYFCEAPNTMLLHQIFDDDHGFIGIGTGSAVTNPMFKTLFSSLASAKSRLMEFSYLMYLAKKNDAWCGGRTISVLVKSEHVEPMRINPLDMEAAEGLGNLFDHVLRTTGSGIIPQPDEEKAKKFAEHIAGRVVDLNARFRQLKFRALDGTEIV
jgi:hypothetical protein